ncbi:MAG: hypothetical protein ABL963_06835 [Longimicrobiales bacterium]
MDVSGRTLAEKLQLWAMIAVGWFFAALFVLIAGRSVIEGGWGGAGAMLLMSAVVCPAVRIPASLRPWSIGVALIVMFVGVGFDAEASEERTSREAAQVQARGEADRLDGLRMEFSARRAELVAMLEAGIRAGDPVPALQAAAPMREVADEQFLALLGTADAINFANRLREREQWLVAEARSVPANDLERNRELYLELVSIDSTNATYRERLSHYSGLVLDRQREQIERRERLGEPPSRSALDGNYREVSEYLRGVANDPGSIDVAQCTDVYFTEDGWLVGCDYRGANAFGALVFSSNWFLIRQGRVIRVEPKSAYNPG